MSATNGHNGNGNGNGHRKGTPRAGTIKHPPDVIARAIALLALGWTAEQVSRETKLPQSTVRTWRKYLPNDLATPRPKKERIEDLYAQYLEKALLTTLAQLEVASEPTWIREQNAADLGVFHGIVFDKSVRVFEAAQRASERAAAQLPPAAPAD